VRSLALLLGCLLLARTAVAETLLIRDALLHTMTAQAEIDGGDILIEDGRIREIGNSVAAPAGARIIEAAGKQVTPGLIGAYTHIGALEIDLTAPTVDVSNVDKKISAAFRVAPAFNPNSLLIPHNRAHGLTLAVSAPEPGHNIFSGQGAVIRLGAPATLIDDSVAAFAVYGELADSAEGGSRATAMARLRLSMADALEYAANRKAVTEGNWRSLSLPLHDLEALIPVVQGKKRIVIVAHRASDIDALLDLKRDFKLQLIIAGATEAWMVANRLAAEKVPVIVNPLVNMPLDFDRLGARLDSATLLERAGVMISFSSVGYFTDHAAYLIRQVAGNAVAYGLSRDKALAAITRNNAETFGLGTEYGSLAPGMNADLVIWSGDPLELMTHAETVIVGGKVMPMTTRSDRLRERYRKLDSELPAPYRK
jgi:imidazolonepropionase-like amidohydrolase